MMRIAFDATALPPVAGGAGNYILRLVAALRDLGLDDRVYVICKPEDVERLGPWPGGSFFEPVAVRLRGRVHRLCWEQVGLPGLLRRLGAELLHSPHYTVPLAAPTRRVVTFHDMIFFLYPQYHDRLKVVFFRRMMRRSSVAADHIITDSESTRSDTIRILGVPRDRITTVPLGVEERYRPITDPVGIDSVLTRHSLSRPFVLSVCTLEPRKNLAGLIGAFRLMRIAGFNGTLAIAGAKGWHVESIFNAVAAPDRDAVRFLGYVPDADLPALYSACAAFVYPSFYEGFGLPVLEAMACGAAVITSDRSSTAEVAGGAALLCEPSSASDIAAKTLSVLADRERRRELGLRATARATAFTWRAAAERTHEVYARVCGRPRHPVASAATSACGE
jgi:glycosyltransferase involved in cell wall biosynthesis